MLVDVAVLVTSAVMLGLWLAGAALGVACVVGSPVGDHVATTVTLAVGMVLEVGLPVGKLVGVAVVVGVKPPFDGFLVCDGEAVLLPLALGRMLELLLTERIGSLVIEGLTVAV